MGTAKVVLPSSVDHAAFATSEKFSIPGKSFSATSSPSLKISRDLSNGRQATRSPAVPALSLASKTALYSVGAVGEKTTSISGCFFLKAGKMVSRQIFKSSLRQLSIVNWALPCAQTLPTPARETSPNRNVTNLFDMGLLIVRSNPAQNNHEIVGKESLKKESGVQELQEFRSRRQVSGERKYRLNPPVVEFRHVADLMLESLVVRYDS